MIKRTELPFTVSAETIIEVPCLLTEPECRPLFAVISTAVSNAKNWREVPPNHIWAQMSFDAIQEMPSITFTSPEDRPNWVIIKITLTHALDDTSLNFIKRCFDRAIMIAASFEFDSVLCLVARHLTSEKMHAASLALQDKLRNEIRNAQSREWERKRKETISEHVFVGCHNVRVTLYERQLAVNWRISLSSAIVPPEEENSSSDSDD